MKKSITHICQISKETTLLNGNKKSEPYLRQCDYLSTLKEKAGQDAEMTIIVLARNSKKLTYSENGLNIVAISASFWIRFFGIFFTIYRLHRTTQITVLTTQAPIDEGWTTLLFGKIFRIPVIAQIHFDIFNKEAINQILGKGLRGDLRFYFFKKLIKYYYKVRPVGRTVAQQLVIQCGCKEDQIVQLPVFIPLLNRTNFIYPEKTDIQFKILFVGRLVEQKNLFLLLDIASETIKLDKSILFEIVGDGPLKHKLIEKCKKLEIQDNVIFYGEIANDLLPEYYMKADIFILTSFYEGLPRVPIEAGAFKLPFLSTKVGGSEEIIVQGHNGFLFELSDMKGFIEKIIYLKNNPDKRKDMGLNNFNLVNERYNPKRLKEKWIDLLLLKEDTNDTKKI